MKFIRYTGVYVLLVIFIITSNGFMLMQKQCSCDDKTSTSCSALDCSNAVKQMSETCQCIAAGSCCTEKKDLPKKDDCKCSFLFCKIPVFSGTMQKTEFNTNANIFFYANNSDNIFNDYTLRYSSKLIKPPGNNGRSTICMISSFLL
jgi:hypothetical protein